MKIKTILYIESFLLIFLSLIMVCPLVVSLIYGENDFFPLLYSIIISAVIGVILNLLFKKYKSQKLASREGFVVVSFGWIFASLIACLPFIIHGSIPDFTDAFFEVLSGFTTTGSTILTDIEVLPHGLLFWRSMTHWLGGMGIILLTLAILPLLGVGGMQLYKAEVPGPVSEKITPRITQTAKVLWGVYLLMTIVETVLLMFGGMDLFDALCHTFGTLATGGFSTKNASIGHYNAYSQYVITIFMFLAGVNFTLHYRLLLGNYKSHIKDTEFKFYFGVIIVAIILIFINTWGTVYDNVEEAFRYISFQVVAIVTTTGYGTFDFEQWNLFCQFLLVILMFIGGCAGSTGGGMKNLRIMLVLKYMYYEILKFIKPNQINLIKINNKVVPDKVMTSVIGFVIIYILIFAMGTLLMTLLGEDMVTSFSSIAATLNNIGPGLAKVGPTKNYAEISTAGKWVLNFCMLAGRLEIFSVIVLLVPATWKK